MMPKLKREHASECEARASGSNSERTSVSASVDNHSEQQQQQPAKKKLKSALNFSIESIMQPTNKTIDNHSPDSSSLVLSATTKNLHKVPYNQASCAKGERLESVQAAASWPSLLSSSSSTSSSSRAGGSSPSSAVSNNSQDSRGSSPAPSFGSPVSPTSVSPLSRASTPISPGGNPATNGGCRLEGELTDGNGDTCTMNSTGKSGKSTKRNSSSGSSWSKERGGSTNQLLKQQVCHDPRLAPFECHLDNLELWHRFHPLDTEMIITKQGRRMFPPVRVTFSLGAEANGQTNANSSQTNSNGSQLNPRDKYQVLMDILPYDNKRYRYAYHKSSWQQAGKADPPSPTKLFLHPDGPFTLDQLKRQVISFEKIKLTNNDANKHGYIVLNSMHKYQPRIHLVLWRGKDSQSLANAPISQLEQETHKTFIFSETIFTAVTAYQNHSITKLKIDSNPFAKGFRDSSRLTDLELESMQDLISDGQCPFSPPRAPPHGFPHFLFAAAAAQQQHQHQHQHQTPGGGPIEDPASTLLRERTIMALDSFLQQQQHQQVQHHASNQSPGSPHRQSGPQAASQGPPGSQQMLPPPPPYSLMPPFGNNSFGAFIPPPPPPVSASGGGGGGGGGVGGQAGVGPNGFEAMFMQQQQQFAAALAAASGAHQSQLHGLFALPPGPMVQAHRSPNCNVQTPTTPTSLANVSNCGPCNKSASLQQSGTPSSPHSRNCQLSPIGLQKPTELDSLGGYMPPTSATKGPPGNPMGHLNGGGPPPPPYFHPQHLQAVMAAHHKHQMATLSMLEQQASGGALHQPELAAAAAAAAMVAAQASAGKFEKRTSL